MEEALKSLHLINNIYAFLSVIIVVSGILLYKYGQKLIDVLSKKINNKPISDLKYHDMFNTAQAVKQKVHQIEFISHGKPDPVKTTLLHKLIDLKIDCVTRSFSEFLENSDLEDMSENQLKFEVSKKLSIIVNEYNDEAFKLFISQYGIDQKDSKYLIDCYETFRQEIVEGFLIRLDSITRNDDYLNNYQKLSAILEVIAISLFIIPKDAKNAMDLVNGRFVKYAKA